MDRAVARLFAAVRHRPTWCAFAPMPRSETHFPHVQPEKPTFSSAYCLNRRCSADRYDRRVFWQTLYPHARVIAFFLGFRAECFSADRGLISYCGRLTSVAAIEKELAEFAGFPNRGFLRRVCRIRVSGRRLKKLAVQCLEG